MQDEIDKLNFQLKRKDKALYEFETEIKEMQVEMVSIKNNSSTSNTKHSPVPLSRAEERLREKEESISNNRKDIIIRELEYRLESKSKELEDLMTETSKLRNENSSIKESLINMAN